MRAGDRVHTAGSDDGDVGKGLDVVPSGEVAVEELV